jgi:hypothetical protein
MQDIKEVASRTILKIRAAAGNNCERCPACAKPASMPYRRIVDGVYVEGCVDASHTPHMQGLAMDTAHWHFRAEAVQIRKDTAKFLQSLARK